MNKIVILFFVTIPILAYSQTYRAVDVFDGPQIYWLDNYLKPNVSGSNSTRKVVPVRLPQNTVKWFYSISTTRNMADIEQTKNVFNLFAQLSRLIDNTGISAIVISQIGRPPISNPIDVYLLSSYRDAETFMSKYSNLGSGFNYQAIDSRERFVQGRAEVISNNHMKGMQYIGIRNTDASYGLAVYVQVVAIVEEPEQQTSYSSYNNSGNDEENSAGQEYHHPNLFSIIENTDNNTTTATHKEVDYDNLPIPKNGWDVKYISGLTSKYGDVLIEYIQEKKLSASPNFFIRCANCMAAYTIDEYRFSDFLLLEYADRGKVMNKGFEYCVSKINQ